MRAEDRALRMTVDVGLGRAADDAAYRKTRVLAPWLMIVAVFAAAVLLRQVLPFNVDVSWWLTVGERMLDGQRLYVDFLETNPPMASSVYLLSVELARLTGLRPEVTIDALVFALIAASLTLTWRILRHSSLSRRAVGGALAAWAVVLLGVLPMDDFGQREHLGLIAMLPALGVSILRGDRERVSPAAILIAGLSAAITMSFKPYFAFAIGFSILAAAGQARDWRVLFAPENWIAAALVVLHGICTIFFYPEYFTIIYPLVRDVYLLLKAPLLALILTSATAVWIGSVSIVLASQNWQRKLDTASFVVLAASFGFAVAFFVQRKGWSYHA
jgi:energy-converting hydrogenase Eha subunit C